MKILIKANTDSVAARVKELLDGEEERALRAPVAEEEFSDILLALEQEGFFFREGERLRP